MAKPLPYLRKSPRQKRAEATFEAIVEAAAHILREKGAKGLTTNAIAARAGASIGSLYQYFPDKRAIVRALVEREFRRVEVARPAIIDGDASTEEIVRAIVDWHFGFRGHDPLLFRNLGALVSETLPVEEQQKIATLRRERVARTVGKLVGRRRGRKLAHAAFIVDTCLNAIANEALRREPDLLTAESLRSEVATLLLSYLESDVT
jgi:AcrR family transcriptional regulator